MFSNFNLLGLFTPACRMQIDLREELDARLLRIKEAQSARHRSENAGRMSAHTAGSQGLSIRLDAAAAAELRALMDKGCTTLLIEDGQTVDEALLGKCATQFRIYERDLDKDLRLALGA